MTARLVSSFVRACSGAAAAEMVLILPLVVVLIFTTMEGAYYVWNEHKVVKGVRDAARYAGRLDFSDYDCAAGTFTGNTTPIQNLARTGQLAGGTSVVPGWVNNDITISVDCGGTWDGIYDSNGHKAPRVTVATKFAYPSLFGALGFNVLAVRLGASAESPVAGL